MLMAGRARRGGGVRSRDHHSGCEQNPKEHVETPRALKRRVERSAVLARKNPPPLERRERHGEEGKDNPAAGSPRQGQERRGGIGDREERLITMPRFEASLPVG